MSQVTMVLEKLSSPEYIKNVIMKYLLEAALITFAYVFIVQQNIANNRKTYMPTSDTVSRIFIWTIILFSLLDVLAPQAIPMVRAGIGLCIGTHMAGGIALSKNN